MHQSLQHVHSLQTVTDVIIIVGVIGVHQIRNVMRLAPHMVVSQVCNVLKLMIA